MTVLTKPENNEIQAFRKPPRIFLGRGFAIGTFGRHAMYLTGWNAHGVEQRLARHAVIALRVAGRNGTLIAEINFYFIPRETLGLRQVPVDRARRTATGEHHARPAAVSDGLLDRLGDVACRDFRQCFRGNHDAMDIERH